METALTDQFGCPADGRYHEAASRPSRGVPARPSACAASSARMACSPDRAPKDRPDMRRRMVGVRWSRRRFLGCRVVFEFLVEPSPSSSFILFIGRPASSNCAAPCAVGGNCGGRRRRWFGRYCRLSGSGAESSPDRRRFIVCSAACFFAFPSDQLSCSHARASSTLLRSRACFLTRHSYMFCHASYYCIENRHPPEMAHPASFRFRTAALLLCGYCRSCHIYRFRESGLPKSYQHFPGNTVGEPRGFILSYHPLAISV